MKYARPKADGTPEFAVRNLENVYRVFPPSEEGGEPTAGYYPVNVNYDSPAPLPDDVVAFLLGEGYVPVIESERPSDGNGYRYRAGYEPIYVADEHGEEALDHFLQVWEREDDPVPDPNPEISAERALQIILTGRDTYDA